MSLGLFSKDASFLVCGETANNGSYAVEKSEGMMHDFVAVVCRVRTCVAERQSLTHSTCVSRFLRATKSAQASHTATMVAAKTSLPRLGLGMAALGRPGYINLNRNSILGEGERNVDMMQRQANAVMDRLFTLSSSEQAPWLDCARSYGLSEKFVGEYLKSNNIQPDNVYVSSKWGYS